MRINQPGRDVPAAPVNHQRRIAIRRKPGKPLANRLDLAADEQHIRVLQAAFGAAGPDGGLFNQDGLRLRQRSAPFQRRARQPGLLQGTAPFSGIIRGHLRRLRFIGRGSPGLARPGLGSPAFLARHRVNPAVNPHLADFGLGVKVAAAFHDGEVSQLAGFEGAELTCDAAEFGRNRGQRGQGVNLGQAAVERAAQVGAKLLFVRQPPGGQGDFQAALPQHGGIFGRPIPSPQRIQLNLLPVVFVRQARQFRKIQGHNERRARGLGEIGAAPLLAAGNEAEIQPQFVRDAGGAVGHQDAAGLNGNELLPVSRGSQRREGGIELETRACLRILLIIRLVEGVIARVEERLAHRGDHAHQRGRINAFRALHRREADVLEDLRLNHHRIGSIPGQGDQRTGAANDAPGRGNQAGGEPQRVHGRQGGGLGRIAPHRLPLRGNARHSIAGPGRTAIRLRARDAEESGPARGKPVPGSRFARRGSRRRVGCFEREIEIYESGVDRRAFHLPDPGVRGRRDVFSHRRNPALANDQGAVCQNLAGADDNSPAGQGMGAQRQRTKPRRKKLAGGGAMPLHS
ncbi:MAG: hypothetical protein BWX68_01898 [Verrucomicrobia bacterium ADurb.Bin063]|nr:MAG: hypothetical protein BWX68_01898 [Verrucomicrobia bacterium ADurb.Bin063]